LWTSEALSIRATVVFRQAAEAAFKQFGCDPLNEAHVAMPNSCQQLIATGTALAGRWLLLLWRSQRQLSALQGFTMQLYLRITSPTNRERRAPATTNNKQQTTNNKQQTTNDK
jgi:hypothetical protein